MRHLRIQIYTTLLAILPIPFAYANTPIMSPRAETPASLACIYGLTPNIPGCPINRTSAVPHSGSGVIAVIEGGDDPQAYNELTQFSKQTNLYQLPKCSDSPPPCFQTYYATPTTNCLAEGSTGATPPTNRVGIVEPEIDIEWAHAMAPFASIYMIETESFDDINAMMMGVQCANTLLQRQGGGFVSFSDSFPEAVLGPSEVLYDSNFQAPGVIYVMSSGDYSAPARYPSSSPYVISAGGTSIVRDALGNYKGQVAWRNTEIPCEPNMPCRTGVSGGPSAYEPRPAFQNSVQKIVGQMRGTPDISFVAQGVGVFCCSFTANNQCCLRPDFPANPNKPYLRPCQNVDSSICTSTYGTWVSTGGTSLAAPALAGIINSAHSGARSSAQELTMIYNGALKNYHSYWTDIISGNNGHPALQGYDFTTGLGVPLGYGGK